MLRLSNAILKQPILSLRTGRQVGVVTAPIINPDNFKIEAFYCFTNEDKHAKVLLFQDVRDIINQGFVVDDATVLADPNELIRLKKIIDIHYSPLGKHVQTVDKDKVGKVTDFAVEIETMYIQKIYVSQPLYKNLSGGNLGIDRNQIHEVTPKKIIILNLLGKAPAATPARA